MLTPDEVNGYAGLMAAPWDELSERILRDMVRRIVKTGSVTATAQWQATAPRRWEPAVHTSSSRCRPSCSSWGPRRPLCLPRQ